MEEKKVVISVKNMTKKFKLFYDKPNTLKERLVFWNKKKADERIVLKNINLNITKGETVALIGVNGSGKSTLLKLMTKIIYPTTGKIITNGKLTSLLELGAGFHDDFIKFSELEEFIDNPVRTYSSGMYMRLAFSVAINVDAEILLIDEILAVGDQHFQEKCYEKLKQLKDEGKTMVIVTHD